MGNDGKAITTNILVHAFFYELALWLAQKFPWVRMSPWFILLLENCRPYWVEWKTSLTMKQVDKQVEVLKEQWEKEERETKANALAIKAQELFPDATVTPLPDAVVPSVMIVREAAPNASDDVKALGGELRITYQLSPSQPPSLDK